MKKISRRKPAFLFLVIFLTFLAVHPSRAYAPRIPGLLERIQQPLYDNNTVATSGTGQLNYFQVALGGTPAGTGGTQVQTNRDQGGSLPYPKNFEIHAMRLITQYDPLAADGNIFILPPNFNLNPIGEGGPSGAFPNGRPDQRGIYVLAEPIDLIPQQNFRCEINFPAPQTLSSPVDISIYLDGFFKREVHGDGPNPFGDNVGQGPGGGSSVNTRDASAETRPGTEPSSGPSQPPCDQH